MNKQNMSKKENKESKENKLIIGKKMQLARRKENLTQAQLAEIISVTTDHVSNMERGESYGSVETLINICNSLNISADFLFGNTIHKNSDVLDAIFDDEFVENYLKLNHHNKKTVHTIVTALAKEQKGQA